MRSQRIWEAGGVVATAAPPGASWSKSPPAWPRTPGHASATPRQQGPCVLSLVTAAPQCGQALSCPLSPRPAPHSLDCSFSLLSVTLPYHPFTSTPFVQDLTTSQNLLQGGLGALATQGRFPFGRPTGPLLTHKHLTTPHCLQDKIETTCDCSWSFQMHVPLPAGALRCIQAPAFFLVFPSDSGVPVVSYFYIVSANYSRSRGKQMAYKS